MIYHCCIPLEEKIFFTMKYCGRSKPASSKYSVSLISHLFETISYLLTYKSVPLPD